MRFKYEAGADLASLGASLAFGLAKNHPFVDGNKRVAFSALFTFLGMNGVELQAPESDAVRTMLALASGELSEEDLARWVRESSRLEKPSKKR